MLGHVFEWMQQLPHRDKEPVLRKEKDPLALLGLEFQRVRVPKRFRDSAL